MNDFWVVIPARLQSTRLPRKLLQRIGERTILEHSYRRARAAGARRVVIACDSPEIETCARGFGAEVCLTSASCNSGSERLAEACALLEAPAETVVVNLQADEPFMPPSCLHLCAQALMNDPEAAMSTVA